MLTALVLYGAILPVAAGLFAVGLGATLLRPRERDGPGGWSAGLALVIAYAITHAGLIGWPTFPPSESWQWLAWLGPAAWLAGRLARRAPRPVAAVIQLATCLGIGWLVVPGYDEHAMDLRLATGVSMLIVWRGFDARAGRAPAASAAAVLVLTFAAAAVVIFQTANAKLGQLAGSLAAAAGGMIVPLLIRPGRVLLTGAGATLAVLLVGLLAAAKANDYGDVPFRALVPIAFAPLAVSLRGWSAWRPTPRWKRELVRLGLVAAIVAAGITLSLVGSGSATSDETEEPPTVSEWSGEMEHGPTRVSQRVGIESNVTGV